MNVCSQTTKGHVTFGPLFILAVYRSLSCDNDCLCSPWTLVSGSGSIKFLQKFLGFPGEGTSNARWVIEIHEFVNITFI